MLDVSVRAGILDLLDGLRRGGLGILMITHDLSTATQYADRIMVMYLGRIVEEGPAREVVGNPQHPYTRALISVVPRRDPHDRRQPQILQGETPESGRHPGRLPLPPALPDRRRRLPRRRSRTSNPPKGTALRASNCDHGARGLATALASRASAVGRAEAAASRRSTRTTTSAAGSGSGTTGSGSIRPTRARARSGRGRSRTSAQRSRRSTRPVSRRSSTSTASGATSSSATSTATTARTPGRFLTFCHVDLRAIGRAGFDADVLVESLRRSRDAGARGLKIWKDLGLGIATSDGALRAARRRAARAGLRRRRRARAPGAHPHRRPGRVLRARSTASNERLEELLEKPEWSLLRRATSRRSTGSCASLEALVAAHPGTTFIVAHVGCYPENLAWVDRMLTTYPNMVIDVSQRMAELGRQPRAAARLICKHSRPRALRHRLVPAARRSSTGSGTASSSPTTSTSRTSPRRRRPAAGPLGGVGAEPARRGARCRSTARTRGACCR